MTKLRNISYLRFGSKIRQGFAGGITSLTPPLSLSPLWISWAENEGAREGRSFIFGAGACRPTTWRQGGRGPAARQGAAGTRQEPLRKKIIFIYI